MSEFLLKELNHDIQNYLKIRKVLRIVEFVGVLVVILFATFVKPSISELIFSLLAVLIVPECFIAIQRWGTKSLIKGILLFLNDELKNNLSNKEYYEKKGEGENPAKIGYYHYMCIIIEKKIKKVEDLKRLVIF